jgi:hypothetical protein
MMLSKSKKFKQFVEEGGKQSTLEYMILYNVLLTGHAFLRMFFNPLT